MAGGDEMVSGNFPSTLEKAGGELWVSWARVSHLQPDSGSGMGRVEKPWLCQSGASQGPEHGTEGLFYLLPCPALRIEALLRCLEDANPIQPGKKEEFNITKGSPPPQHIPLKWHLSLLTNREDKKN